MKSTNDLSENMIRNLIKILWKDIKNNSINGKDTGMNTNFYDFDAITQGLENGNLYIFASRPAMGKTSFVSNLALNFSKSYKHPVCFFSLEINKLMLGCRLISQEVGIESGRLKSGKLQQEEWMILERCIKSLSKNNIYINDDSTITINKIIEFCSIAKKNNDNKLGMIVIDNFQLLEEKITGDNFTSKDQLNNIIKQLKSLALSQNIPIILTSQVESRVDFRINKRPMLSDLRDSELLEDYADLIAFIYRDEYYDPYSEDRGITEIIVAKQRNGPVGTVKLLFEPQYTRFRNLAI